MAKVLMSGNEAVGAAAIKGGLQCYFAYPITPQNEVGEYISRYLPEVGGVFLQCESELAAISMVMGAAAAGVRTMTSSSGPGVSLMQEGISYLAGCQLPVVLVNMMRGGPGLGNIAPSQSDYFQATKGGGHGDYRMIVLAPASVQEIVDLVIEAFELAERYRNPVMIIGDGWLGQMMEPVEIPEERRVGPSNEEWALTGCTGRPSRIIRSLYLKEGVLEEWNRQLQEKFARMAQNEIRYEQYNIEGSRWILVAYGTCARICRETIDTLSDEGMRVGLFRPISLWPFPHQRLVELAQRHEGFLVVEMSAGQMLEDVRLAIKGKRPVEFLGRMGGGVPTVEQITQKIKRLMKC